MRKKKVEGPEIASVQIRVYPADVKFLREFASQMGRRTPLAEAIKKLRQHYEDNN